MFCSITLKENTAFICSPMFDCTTHKKVIQLFQSLPLLKSVFDFAIYYAARKYFSMHYKRVWKIGKGAKLEDYLLSLFYQRISASLDPFNYHHHDNKS